MLPPGRASFTTVSPQRFPARRAPVRPDSVDLRDWLYRPSIAVSPRAWMLPNDPRAVKDQKQSNACTGFALATVIETLLARGDRPAEQISGYMLYSMARRYDEWSDNDEADAGSSLRGALKGWTRHGASLARLWKNPAMPAATNDPNTDWWLDAVKRPLGTYYRIAPKEIRDIHVALAEAGVVYASAMIHDGWSALANGEPTEPPTQITQLRRIAPARGTAGHAFAIVGYSDAGFVVQNSWGPSWGHGGFAILTYDDWLQNAMDCWVVQLGVVTSEHEKVAENATLQPKAAGQPVALATDPTLADHQIGPFVVDMENNGELSQRGRFRTNPDDLVQLLDFHLRKACEEWKLGTGDTVDVAIYAHGGLVDEDAAAQTARTWIPLLRSNGIFPIFLMWETGAFKTLTNLLEDFAAEQDKAARDTAGGWWDRFKDAVEDWKNERIESFARWPGGKLWGEMKQNADALARAACRRGAAVQAVPPAREDAAESAPAPDRPLRRRHRALPPRPARRAAGPEHRHAQLPRPRCDHRAVRHLPRRPRRQDADPQPVRQPHRRRRTRRPHLQPVRPLTALSARAIARRRPGRADPRHGQIPRAGGRHARVGRAHRPPRQPRRRVRSRRRGDQVDHARRHGRRCRGARCGDPAHKGGGVEWAGGQGGGL